MKQRQLGTQGLTVSELGLGCMGLSYAYGAPKSEKESIDLLKRSLDLGVNFWDTAEIYGPYTNEELIGRALKQVDRNKVVIATKFGFSINDKHEVVGVNSKPEHIMKAVDGSLKRLGIDCIDLYYQHRLDPEVPIEEAMGALAMLVELGKIKYIGLSEVGSDTIRRAHALHPVSAVQSEYSLWERGVEESILPTLNELKIGFVPYSPLGRGFFSNAINHFDELSGDDWRKSNYPRMSPEHFEHNFTLVKQLRHLAMENNVSASQIALAWLLRQGEHIVPIPGTKHINYLEDNCAAVELLTSKTIWKPLEKILENFKPSGERYTQRSMQLIER